MSVISFQDLLNEKKQSAKKENSKKTSSLDSKTKEEIKETIAAAKAHGLNEIEMFKKKTAEYLEFIDKTAIFSGGYSNLIKQTSETLCEEFLRPIVLGEDIPGMPEELYMEIRKAIYEELMGEIKKS